MLALALLLARPARRARPPHRLRYFAIAAAISYAIPNLLMFSAIPHLGAGYTGIMFTLSPVITLVLSILLGVRRPNLLGIAGIAVGFVGALMVALTRGEAGQPADLFWVVIGLLIPVSLAAGNIYRTFDWPEEPGRSSSPSAAIWPRRRCCWSACSLHAAASALSALLAKSPLLVARAGRVGVADVCVLLPAAGGRRAGLSQPDRLCRGRGRADLRHLFPRRALPGC